ncbi:MAG: DUF1080 domain-containing protein [Verrucomicrobia bacterium]|nr:MAG: DUF1080 domain-containing protein [Verrucomicrobiota bacterium]TAE86765.1 MAG: DUF1080 domain-containing protein [Verrucomicrobiota bacterium]TAF24519.1 MAG: DUF1080 domain-containing protein [Verrucomicrobiota bacterium]
MVRRGGLGGVHEWGGLRYFRQVREGLCVVEADEREAACSFWRNGQRVAMKCACWLAILVGLGSAMAEERPWVSLFDGKSLAGWVSSKGGPPSPGWVVEDGCIHRKAGGGDLLSEKEFADFELEFEWKISSGGNSGVKYRLRKTPLAWVGPEYQVLDDLRHVNGKVADTTAASLYDVVPASRDKGLRGPGEWNFSRIVARGSVLEHWLNGNLAMRVDGSSDKWKQLKKDSKFAKLAGFGEAAAGPILLQDHGDEVWFRGIRIRCW